MTEDDIEVQQVWVEVEDPLAHMQQLLHQSMTAGDFEALDEDSQNDYLEQRALAIDSGGACCPMVDPSSLGTSSFSEVLCKLWRWIVGAAKAIIDGVKEVLVDLVNAVFKVLDPILEGLSGLGGSLLKNPLFWLAAGALVWYFWPDKEEENERQDIEGTAQDLALTYYTGGVM